jgi:hypothetical protein
VPSSLSHNPLYKQAANPMTTPWIRHIDAPDPTCVTILSIRIAIQTTNGHQSLATVDAEQRLAQAIEPIYATRVLSY